MSRKTDRREFLETSARTGAGLLIVSAAAACARIKPHVGPRRVPPSEKLNVACVAAGGKGGSDAGNCKGENVVALCDADWKRAAKTFKSFPKARTYKDFREMLEKEEKNIDAVTVSTPDHTHTAPAVMAMQMGKHVYVQKPLTRTVWECRVMRETARKYGVATQMGNQGTAHSGLRRAVELLHAGVLGPVHEAHVWTNRPIWPQGMDRPVEIQPIREDLAWEVWLGPAPWRPYNEAYLPFSWRGWVDFGSGALGDMACHTLNMPFWGLKLGYPTSVEAEVPKLYAESFPEWSIIRYEFPAREGLPPVKLTWYDGGKRPSRELFAFEKDEKVPESGALVIGEKGQLYSSGDYGTSYQLLPESRFEGFEGPPETIPRLPGDSESWHVKEWLSACKGGPPAMSNFEYSAFLTEVVVLGNVALRLGKKIEWDAPNMKARNCPEADQLIKPYYPKGWVL
ncbi:hypothetical protein AMJ85_06135 [candidate division BRC1 bacterium SM23_51]|nr:MAG: hypothetical protein AMJ85_06135 [candidate division BRC1 bacterium SM23_51]